MRHLPVEPGEPRPLSTASRVYLATISRLAGKASLAGSALLSVRRLRIFGQQDKLRADRSKGRETWV
jgi:hypothetical protein